MKPSSGITFLFEHNLVSKEPEAIAQFLRNSPGLDKTMIGDYLGQHEEFPLSVMHAYVDALNFSRMKFDKAIRMFLDGFRLPGGAQKECFGMDPNSKTVEQLASSVTAAVESTNLEVTGDLIATEDSLGELVALLCDQQLLQLL